MDAEKTSPYEFYQYWRNIDDSDVANCLALLTFIPMDEINQMCSVSDERINDAKKRLAFELTKHIHGETAAIEAEQASKALFESGGSLENMPTTQLEKATAVGAKLIDIMVLCALCASKGEARRLIAGGGVSLNDVKVEDEFLELREDDFKDGPAIIKKGKKVFHRLTLA